MASAVNVILLRGLARERGHWMEFPDTLRERLATHFPQMRVDCLDCVGCGDLYQQKSDKQITHLTDDIRSRYFQGSAQKAQEATKTVLVGLSMGGMIAIDWAQRFPQEISDVVIINSSSGDNALHSRLRPTALLRLLRAMCLDWRRREAIALRIVSNDTQNYTKNLKRWIAIQQQRPVSRSNMIKLLTAASRFKITPDVRLRCLVLASQQDRLVNPKCSEQLAAQHHWPLLVHPHAGHDLPLDDPTWVEEQIAQWLLKKLG